MSFPEDLLVEILSRLPFKSLARFKCVSRSWRDLISGAYLRGRLPLLAAGLFMQVPHGVDIGKPRYATVCSSAGPEYRDMSFFPFKTATKLVDACNGMLLYRSLAAASEFFVANTTTRRWAALPMSRREALLPLLAFDPSSSPHYYVLCFVAWQESGAAVEVFSSEAGVWAEHDAPFGVEPSSLSPTTHYRAGVLHVLAHPDRVVCMDLSTVESPCRVVQLPEDVDADARLGHCRGRLHYAKSDGEQLKVWALDDGEPAGSRQWSLLHAVSVNELNVNGRCVETDVRFLAFHPETMDVVFLWSPGEVVGYDLMKKEIVRVLKLGDDKEGEEGAHVLRFWLLAFSPFLFAQLQG